jgi:hypothetical protein
MLRTFIFFDIGACRHYLRHNNDPRGSGVINPASAATTSRGALTSLTPPPLPQWPEGLRHHRPQQRYLSSPRAPGIIDLASAGTTAQWAATSSTSPPLQQRPRGSSVLNPASAASTGSGVIDPASAASMAWEVVPAPSVSSTPTSWVRHHHNLLQPCAKFPS